MNQKPGAERNGGVETRGTGRERGDRPLIKSLIKLRYQANYG